MAFIALVVVFCAVVPAVRTREVCSYTGTNYLYCSDGSTCCGTSHCCESPSKCCGTGCCNASNICCGSFCCEPWQICCGIYCCFYTCCSGTCCAASQTCCNGRCCDGVCCDGTCYASSCPVSSADRLSQEIWIVITVGSVVGLIIIVSIVVCIICCLKRRRGSPGTVVTYSGQDNGVVVTASSGQMSAPAGSTQPAPPPGQIAPPPGQIAPPPGQIAPPPGPTAPPPGQIDPPPPYSGYAPVVMNPMVNPGYVPPQYGADSFPHAAGPAPFPGMTQPQAQGLPTTTDSKSHDVVTPQSTTT